MVACALDLEWYYYVVVGLITFFGGLVLLIPCRIIYYWITSNKEGAHGEELHKSHRHGWSGFSRIRAAALATLSGQSMSSRVLVIALFLLNMLSVILYLVEASRFDRVKCGTVRDDPIQITYLTLGGIFIIHYIIRFMSATDKLYFWLDIYSIVDHFTIGPTFYGLYTNSNWIGLRFLRLLYLLQLPEALQMMHILKSSSRIRLVQIISIFVSVWFASSGFVHLCENAGDPLEDYQDYQELNLGICIYWMLVTMSTVGYGDYSPSTGVGRTFVCLFIMGTIAMFTAIVPELVRNIGRSSKYTKPYKRVYGKRHIVVCGCINFESVSLFIRNFIHKDSEISGVDIVFIDSSKPDLEMEAFFRRHLSGVTYLRGSVMEYSSLKNSKIRDAKACLILANRNTTDPGEEDAANIMRATSIKNFDPNIRIIIQLLQYKNKTFLLNIPNWNWDKTEGDDVICISELKLGLMAQNCMAPGISTYMANLFTMRSFKGSVRNTWMDYYGYGACNEIYVETFSEAFEGLTFPQAAEICFAELGVLLVAIQDDSKPLSDLRINPTKAIITADTTGFFIAQAPEEVRRVKNYCPDAMQEETEKGKLGLKIKSKGQTVPVSINGVSDQDQHVLHYLEGVGSRLASEAGQGRQCRRRYSCIPTEITVPSSLRRPSMDIQGTKQTVSNPAESFDYTGLFYWCPSRNFDQFVLDRRTASELQLRNHVIVCVLSDEDSPLVGLANFVMPLRTSNFHLHDLKDIVILGNPEYIQKEWESIANFPSVYVYPGTPSRRTDLRAINVERCSMCVILSVKKKIIVDQTMLDKEIILTNLNVKGMSCGDVEERIKSIGILANPQEFRKEMEQFYEIPMLTELEIDSNVSLLDQDDEDDPDIPLFMTQPYACGTTFAVSCLDSLLSATYSNRKILTLARAMITGSETAEFEEILAEGLGIVRRHSSADIEAAKERSHLTMLPLDTGLFSTLQTMPVSYGALFVMALKELNILCLGLYRLLSAHGNGRARSYKRYVITNPPYDFELFSTDRVFCYAPSSLASTPLEKMGNNNDSEVLLNPSTSDALIEEEEHL